jgi:SAM-dependent methyltransferase
MPNELPYPPLEMRKLVGPTELEPFDNPSGNLIYDCLPPEAYQSVLDFGCGCGRNARKLIQQTVKPEKYVGIDLHAGMIKWCQENLTPRANEFTFFHHDVFNAGFNPTSTKQFEPFPSPDNSFSLIITHSVFTHLVEEVVVDYLKECVRVLKPDGYLYSTWFLFDKQYFPMMQEFQHALYINSIDPTNAVIYDHNWLYSITQEVGLTPTFVVKPRIRGYQWMVVLRPAGLGLAPCELGADDAEFGVLPPPADVVDAHLIGT